MRLVTNRAVQAGFKKMLAFLAEQIAELEQAIAALIEADPLWRELNQAFRTISGSLTPAAVVVVGKRETVSSFSAFPQPALDHPDSR